MTRILLVDDHNLFREVLATTLHKDIHLNDNLQAESLADVRRLLRGSYDNIDLAIVEVDLPNEEGVELIEELRGVDIPVLALTIGRGLQGRARAVRAGAAVVLSTMVPREEIIRAAKRLLGG